MNQALIITVAVLAFLLLAVFCVRTRAPVIEANLQERAVTVIEKADLRWAEVVADGRNITVRGLAPSAQARDVAANSLAAISGVRRVDNEIQLPDEVFRPAIGSVAYETRITVSPGFVRYTGFVPDDDVHETVIAQTRRLFPNRRVEDEMVMRPEAPENWLEAVSTLQQRFSTYENGEAVISGNNLNVLGAVAPGRESEEKLLASRLPGNYVAQINLSVARGESIESCQRRLDELMEKQINFEVASEIISSDSFQLLDQLASRIAACGGLRIEIAGHTDSEGLAMKNLELSQRRAEAVVAYLVGAGLDPDQLVPWGYGESRPIADNSTVSGRAVNRRIEFRAMN